jgi:hypothetical protein
MHCPALLVALAVAAAGAPAQTVYPPVRVNSVSEPDAPRVGSQAAASPLNPARVVVVYSRPWSETRPVIRRASLGLSGNAGGTFGRLSREQTAPAAPWPSSQAPPRSLHERRPKSGCRPCR